MFEWLQQLLLPAQVPTVTQSLVTLMLAIGFGVFLGRIRLGKITLGVAGVMFAGLLLGHFGYRADAAILDFVRDFGLILFVYGIGLQVGPSFFSSFKDEGLRFNFLAVSTVLLGGVISIGLFYLTGLRMEDLVGIMSGSVTNTPGLGAAKNTIEEIQNSFPDKTFGDPAIGYAITYPLGVFGIILTLIIARIWLKISPENEMKKFRLAKINRELPLIHRKVRVTQEAVVGKTLGEILKQVGKPVVISRLKQSGSTAVKSPAMDSIIQMRDVLMLVGQEDDVDTLMHIFGRESSDLFIESDKLIQRRNLFVTKSSAVHKKLSELDL